MIFRKTFNTATLTIAVSTKNDGDMAGNSNMNSIRKFLRDKDLNIHFSQMTQDHGIQISQAKKDETVNGDGVVARNEELCLVVRTADCLPVIFFDPQTKSLLVLHCGFRGVRDGIIDEAIRVLKQQNSDFSKVFAFLGPCICEDCYEVDEERYKYSKKLYPDAVKKNGKEFHFNLRAAVLDQLITHGIVASNVQQLDRCTKEDREFFSYRKGDKNERFVTVAQAVYV